MKIRRKSKKCLNCGFTLGEVDNYCAYCGQENNDNNVSIFTLVHDFFSNYFAFDSKIGKSIKPFFIKPGFLTNKFMEGKRMSYVHPLRLYLVVSVFYFFIMSILWTSSIEDQNFESLSNLDNLEETSNKSSTIAIDTVLHENISTDSLIKSAIDSIRVQEEPNSDIDPAATFNFIKWAKQDSISDEVIMDSLKIERTIFNERMVKQIRKVLKGDIKLFVSYAIQNFPIMMFLILPVFALILKLLYFPKGHLYIKHLIHALHIHSFAYIIYGVGLIIIFALDEGSTLDLWIYLVGFVLVSTYAYLSFLRVYKQGWFKTLVKFNLTGILYILFLFLFVLAEFAVSLFLF